MGHVIESGTTQTWEEGYQSLPVNWVISSECKRSFFKMLSEATDTMKPPETNVLPHK
jgi:hypothetical protein